MIDSTEAERIATEIMGPASAPGGRGWRLIEFDAGWVIRSAKLDGPEIWFGGGHRVVERASGRVVRFGSLVALDSILKDYDRVVDEGLVEDRDRR
jgi:hypothetical protein